jgi:hypothetical protein
MAFEGLLGMGIASIRRLHMLGSILFSDWERNVSRRKSSRFRILRKLWRMLVCQVI